MGCANPRPSSKKDKEENQQQRNKEENPASHPPRYVQSFIPQAQKKDIADGFSAQPSAFPPPEMVRKGSSSMEAQEGRSVAKGEGSTNKENKQQSKKQLLKKYDIKVSTHAQRVLPVNSYRYDILLPHNPTIEDEQALTSPKIVPRE